MASSTESQFLEILLIKHEKPSLEFLNRIIKAHLREVPWENISKILRKKNGQLNLPIFEEYVKDLRERQFGGTCHAHNTHLTTLLNHLGFEATLISAVPEGLPSHVAIRVKIDQHYYFVDVGLMSSFAGAFLLDPQNPLETKIGDQRFMLNPEIDFKNWTLQIFRGEKRVRTYKTNPHFLDRLEHAQAIQSSNSDEAYFTQVFTTFRCLGNEELGIWNNKFYQNQGVHKEEQILNSPNKISEAFAKVLLLPHYPIHEVIGILALRGIDIFSPKEL